MTKSRTSSGDFGVGHLCISYLHVVLTRYNCLFVKRFAWARGGSIALLDRRSAVDDSVTLYFGYVDVY